MPSLRPSEYNQLARTDGGPFLFLVPAEPDGEGVDVYFTDTMPGTDPVDAPAELLLNVTPEHLTIYPLHVRRDRDNYLTPKYGKLERIVVTHRVGEPFQVPQSTAEVEDLLSGLPDGFSKDFRHGLGVLWEYRSIIETIASLDVISILIVHGGQEATLDPPFYILGQRRFQALKTELHRIATRHQRAGLIDKRYEAYRTLLHAADPERYPQLKRRIRTDAISDMTSGGTDSAALSKRDRRAVVRMVRDSVGELAKDESRALLALKSEIELVTLTQLIERFEEMLGKTLTESRWQAFFQQNPFILSLAFAVPALMIQDQAYAGGKRIDGHGGKHIDFLYASAKSGNLALVEIKTPDSALLTKQSYRGNDLFAPSAELSGAVAQVLDQRYRLQTGLPGMKSDMNRYDIHGFAIRCVVVAGKTPTEHQKTKSFELVRNALSEVVILTFDELLQRLKDIQAALTPFEPDIPIPASSSPWAPSVRSEDENGDAEARDPQAPDEDK